MAHVLSELRRTRRTRRLGDTEWFDLAYRVYLAAIFGGSAIIVLSDRVGDRVLDDERAAEILRRGPAAVGVLVMIVVACGLRSGSHGGPLAVESADAQHLLLAPISRSRVLQRPFWQRLRSAGFAGALAGGVAGLLAEQRIPSSAAAWTWWGAVFGAGLAALGVATSAIAHAVKLGSVWATAVGAVAIGAQVATAATERQGPADLLGGVAFWGTRVRAVEALSGVAVSAAVVAASLLLCRLRIEPLARRTALVSQLRFAVTMQDLRTVVLLRRQLGEERPRQRPWMTVPPLGSSPGAAAIRRGAHGVARMPLGRIARLIALAAIAGGAAGVGARGTTPAFAVCGLALFILGLDLIEPLAQEIDHPDRTEALPLESGWLHERLLVAPLVLAIPMAFIAAGSCAIVAPRAALAAFVLAVPITWGGVAGAVVSLVRDERDTRVKTSGNDLVVPMEVSGVRDVVRLLLPVIVSSVGLVVAFAVRARPDAAMVARGFVGLVLWLGLLRWWLVHRRRLRASWRSFAAGGAA